ncbi:alpha/beta fold hydrolase [Nocardia sp. NPDC057440]|uniref:alpha/beta fold hydrolase n=1 Tax=Nocardia sp. NPDC057440 TaxID=3346134 RepID=UPI00367124F5
MHAPSWAPAPPSPSPTAPAAASPAPTARSWKPSPPATPSSASTTPAAATPPRSTTPLSLDDLADQLVAAAVAEGLDTFAVSGYSLGGPVAIRAAARHPERVTALVLTATFPHPDNRLMLATSLWRKLAESGDSGMLAEYLTMMAVGADALEAIPDEQLQQAVGFTAASIADGTPEHAELAPRVDVRDDLAHIKVPTLVISTIQDWFTSTRLHRQLADGIPGAQLAEIRTGHLPMVERPDEWQQLITDEPHQGCRHRLGQYRHRPRGGLPMFGWHDPVPC